MIDTHSHIYCEEFDDDRDAVVERTLQAGVHHIILPGENCASVPLQCALRDRYPNNISVALGLHPEEVNDSWRDELAQLRPLLDTTGCIAVGEIGLDLYWDKTYRDQQIEALDSQLRWCNQLDLPFIIHCREAFDEMQWVLGNFGEALPRGVFHCFSGTASDIENLRRHGDFYFGIGGVVTFKKSTLPQLLPVMGLDRILLETDSPYMAPVPHRGKRNESSYIPLIAERIAQVLETTIDKVSSVTDASANDLFKLKLNNY